MNGVIDNKTLPQQPVLINNLNLVGIIGCGTMGSGIAQVVASAGYYVKIFDINLIAIEKSKINLENLLSNLFEKGKINATQKRNIKSNIFYTNNLSDLSSVDLVIEAIIENLVIKQKLFADLEKIVSPQTILATNTSSISITAIAAPFKYPSRFIGIHFFNPAPLMQLVEIVPAFQTSKSTIDKTINIITNFKKSIALVKDTPGFVVNRVARPFYGEALRLYEEGFATIETIDFAMKSIGNFKMGPFQLMDFIGNDVNYAVTESVFESFYFDPRYKPSLTQKRLVQAGYLGLKSGRGFYDYSVNAIKKEPESDSKMLQKIFERILMMLINEAAECLYLNIATASAIDNAMIKAVNYPKGLLSWANEIGIQNCVNKIDELYNKYHEERYRCSPILRTVNKIAF